MLITFLHGKYLFTLENVLIFVKNFGRALFHPYH